MNKEYDLESPRGRAELLVDKFNRAHPVGSSVRYLKSDIESFQITEVEQPAYIQGEDSPMVLLEGIGIAAISKTEPV